MNKIITVHSSSNKLEKTTLLNSIFTNHKYLDLDYIT